MAVTLEPSHLANAPFLRDLLPATRTPVAVADAAEIEGLVTITDTPTAQLLRERGADAARSTWSLDTVLQGRCHPHTSGRQSRSRGQRHGAFT